MKSSAGQVFGWHLSNTGWSSVFMKFYNQAGPPLVGTSTVFATLYVPPGQITSVEHTNGIAFSSGIGIRATAGVADDDIAAPGSNAVVVNVFYK